ncbi:MAG: response regulator, partial [Thalassolituus sp.]
METLPTILIIDDEIRSLETLRRILDEDFDVKTASTVTEARAILAQEWVQIVLCDQRMPEITGVEFLKQIRDEWPDVIRMVISGYTDSADIISAVNDAGIYQYITKPWQPDSLILTLKNATRLFDLQRQNEALSVELKMMPSQVSNALEDKRQQLRNNYQVDDGIVRTANSPMNDVCDHIR